MAAEETAFYPRVITESYSVTGATGPGSLLKRNSTGGAVSTNYYSSFDNPGSASIQSSGDTLPTLTSAASGDSPSGFLGQAAEDSSDHEREDSDGDSLSEAGTGVRSYKRCYSGRSSGSPSVHLLGHGGGRGLQGRIEFPDKEDALREDVAKFPPHVLTCTLIPAWAVKNCELCEGKGMCLACRGR